MAYIDDLLNPQNSFTQVDDSLLGKFLRNRDKNRPGTFPGRNRIGGGQGLLVSRGIPDVSSRFAVSGGPNLVGASPILPQPEVPQAGGLARFGRGLQGVFNDPSALGNIAAGISLLEGNPMERAFALKDALAPTIVESDGDGIPGSYGKAGEGFRYISDEFGDLRLEAIPGGKAASDIQETIRKNNTAIATNKNQTDAYLADINTIRNLITEDDIGPVAGKVVESSLSGNAVAVRAAIKRIGDKEFVRNLSDLKAAGATLGQVTETEGERLEKLNITLDLKSSDFFKQLDRLTVFIDQSEKIVVDQLVGSNKAQINRLAEVDRKEFEQDALSPNVDAELNIGT